MKHRTYTSIIAFALAACFIFATSANTQDQLLITLQQPPDYQFNIEYFWRVTLLNRMLTTAQHAAIIPLWIYSNERAKLNNGQTVTQPFIG